MKTFAVLTLLCSISVISYGQDQSAKQSAKRPNRPKNPAMQAVVDVPGLPRVLLIGDSISIGYTVPVRELLKGVANVHRPLTNCGPTTNGTKNLDKWLGNKKWDVIHFNWGLHDLKYMGPQGQNLADPSAADSKPQVPIDQYEKNLRELVERLKKTNAKLIWRSTTPVPPGAKGRVVGDAAKYNQVAKKIMDEFGIAIDDQYSFAMKRLDQIQQPRNVHFSKAGSRALAEQTVIAIKKELDK